MLEFVAFMLGCSVWVGVIIVLADIDKRRR